MLNSEHTYVDLGLPSHTLWATCNLGAKKPEELGSYFSWGETKPIEKSENNSFYDDLLQFDCDDELDCPLIVKYNDSDNLTILQPEDDAATACWGADWQIPTDDEWSELIDNCEWAWEQYNGTIGYKGIGPNGNSIFIPVSTNIDENTEVLDKYWTSSIYDMYNAYGLEISYESIYLHDIRRHAEALIRPIRNQNQHPLYFTVSFYGYETEFSKWSESRFIEMQKVEKGKSANTNGIVVPEKYEHTFVGWDKPVDNITSNIEVYAVYKRKPFTNHDYVDLGLPSHTLWATCNVGATKPEESGDYFMWGETEPKMMPHPNAIPISNPNAIEDYPGKDFLKFKSEHDAATTNWGELWITPTLNDFIELEECCQWTWIMQDEVYGYKVTGPNGNYIFLPATGEYCYKDLLNVGKRGGYWTCSPTHMTYNTQAVVFQFDSESSKCDTSLIEIRYTVRPIRIRK